MTVEALRALERAHAVIAWAAAAALVAASWIVARGGPPRRGAIVAGGAAVALVVAAGATGIALNDPYRAKLRQRLFLASTRLGWLFEQKLHLAFGALLFAVAAAASLGALALVERRAADPAIARDLRRSAVLAWTASAIFAAAAAVASAIVARHARF